MFTLLRILSKFNKTVENIIKPIISVALLAITMVLSFNVAARYLLGFSIKWAEELANYTIIYITFFGAVVCLKYGMHISMDAVVDKIGERWQNILLRVNAVIGIFFSFVMSWYGYQLVGFVIGHGQLSPAMMIPMAVPYMAIPTASLLIGLEFLEILLTKRSGLPAKTEGELS